MIGLGLKGRHVGKKAFPEGDEVEVAEKRVNLYLHLRVLLKGIDAVRLERSQDLLCLSG